MSSAHPDPEATPEMPTVDRSVIRHSVLILGAGQAGVSLAARLRRDDVDDFDDIDDIALVDPIETHHYRPLLSYVGGGQARMRTLRRPQRKVVPRGVRWYQQLAVAVDPVRREVTLADGTRLAGDDLVLCPGVDPDWAHVPGSREAVFSEHGSSNYVDERAPHTWELIRGLESGRAVFVVADGPVPCAGAGLKPLFLAADHWRRTGRLGGIAITALVGWDPEFGIDRIDDELTTAAARYGIDLVTGARIDWVDPVAREVHVSRSADDATPRAYAYDLLHFVPRHRAPDWVRTAGLAAPSDGVAETDDSDERAAVPGMIAVDPTTFEHRVHPQVWALGDAADVQASRSGGALRKQAAVVADNLGRRRTGRPPVHYTGYSTAPITVSRRRVVLAEFDRARTITPSVPLLDLTRPRVLTWAYDRFLQPWLYWHSILKGRIRR